MPEESTRWENTSQRLVRPSRPGRPASLRRPEGRTSCYPSPSWFLSATPKGGVAAERNSAPFPGRTPRVKPGCLPCLPCLPRQVRMVLLEGREYFLQLAYRVDVKGLCRSDVIFLPEQAGYISLSPDFISFSILRNQLPVFQVVVEEAIHLPGFETRLGDDAPSFVHGDGVGTARAHVEADEHAHFPTPRSWRP